MLKGKMQKPAIKCGLLHFLELVQVNTFAMPESSMVEALFTSVLIMHNIAHFIFKS